MDEKRSGTSRLRRRGVLVGLGAATGSLGTVAWYRGTQSAPALPERSTGSRLYLDDASELSETPIFAHETVTASAGDATDNAIKTLLEKAANERRPLIPSTARHSMGGQSLPEDGIALTLDQDDVSVDPERGSYRVAAGTRWRGVIRTLDALGFSPAVMQSNNDFGVASTFSVNAHGWPVPYSGCGATVREIRMITAGGREITCSRDENPETFSAAMGGYGLFGVITELELDMVPNQRLVPRFEKVGGDDFGLAFRTAIDGDPSVSMAYGRADVTHERFFDDAMIVTYRPSPDQADLPPAPGSGLLSKVSRHVFRAQVENERMKGLRWWFETGIGPRLQGETTRNALLNEPVITLDDRDPARTDILHEYFIPPDTLADFFRTCRDVIPNSYQQLLNVTLRFVRADTESLLSYAPGDRIAAVMLFSQEKSARAEADMSRLTQLLINGALSAGGSYYLPYRLHATQAQFEAAYPGAREFGAAKRRLDPDGRFSNALWATYMEGIG